ncbi:hypothetical protein H1R20_g746, partial [Candolleomyces eurysporus]
MYWWILFCYSFGLEVLKSPTSSGSGNPQLSAYDLFFQRAMGWVALAMPVCLFAAGIVIGYVNLIWLVHYDEAPGKLDRRTFKNIMQSKPDSKTDSMDSKVSALPFRDQLVLGSSKLSLSTHWLDTSSCSITCYAADDGAGYYSALVHRIANFLA